MQDAGDELRTPLTTIRTNVELLRRAPNLDVADRDAAFSDTIAEIGELSILTTTLVDLAAGDGSAAHEAPEIMALGDVVERAVSRVRRRADQRITLTLDDPAELPMRPQAIDRAVGNLVDNAMKFAGSEREIEVVARHSTVLVIDHGPGISADDSGHVFERFYRSTAARSKPGSGLGLAIVAQVVADHGGRTTLAETPGGGLTIGFELPAPARTHRGKEHAPSKLGG